MFGNPFSMFWECFDEDAAEKPSVLEVFLFPETLSLSAASSSQDYHCVTEILYKFVEKWERSPLFSSQSKRNQVQFKKQREDRMAHNPIQLSKALKAFSQGNMRSYEEEFLKFNFPLV